MGAETKRATESAFAEIAFAHGTTIGEVIDGLLQKIERLELELQKWESLAESRLREIGVLHGRLMKNPTTACQCGWCSDCLRRERGAKT